MKEKLKLNNLELLELRHSLLLRKILRKLKLLLTSLLKKWRNQESIDKSFLMRRENWLLRWLNQRPCMRSLLLIKRELKSSSNLLKKCFSKRSLSPKSSRKRLMNLFRK